MVAGGGSTCAAVILACAATAALEAVVIDGDFDGSAGAACRRLGIQTLEGDVLGLVPRFGDRPDLMVLASYRKVLAAETIRWPRLGTLKVHPSLLPRYRGSSALNWQLVNGETAGGVTVHWVNEVPDSGDLVSQMVLSIEFEDTAADLVRKVNQAAARLIRATLPMVLSGSAGSVPQDSSRATFYRPLRRCDGAIRWFLPAESVYNLVRALVRPWPGAWAVLGGREVTVWSCEVVDRDGDNGVPGKILEASGSELIVQCGKGIVKLTDWEGTASPRKGDRFLI